VTGFSLPEHTHRAPFTFDADHLDCLPRKIVALPPSMFSPHRQLPTAAVAAVAQYRGSARSAYRDGRRHMNILHPRADPDVRTASPGVTVHYDIDADASPEEIEALVASSRSARRYRHHDQPDQRRRRHPSADPDWMASPTNVSTVVIGATTLASR
jgi:hypothetical protein